MFLERIIEIKKEEVRERKKRSRFKELRDSISSLPQPRDFIGAISRGSPLALIAEIKWASPSSGLIRERGDISFIANQYQSGGASAISVLTEVNFFKGDLSNIQKVKEETDLPVLQKDFIIDSFQIYEGRLSGADAILLIASILKKEEIRDFFALIQDLKMTPLIEIHDEVDLEKISSLNLPLIGINNRDLKTFQVDLRATLRLKKEISPKIRVISESGIRSRDDVRILKDGGVDGILVGESLMRSSDPVSKIKELLSI